MDFTELPKPQEFGSLPTDTLMVKVRTLRKFNGWPANSIIALTFAEATKQVNENLAVEVDPDTTLTERVFQPWQGERVDGELTQDQTSHLLDRIAKLEANQEANQEPKGPNDSDPGADAAGKRRRGGSNGGK